MRRLMLMLVLAVVAAACASAPRLPPKSGPEEVQAFDPQLGQYPEPGYRTIGPVRVERGLGSTQQELILALRTAAARLGADAVIVQGIRRTTEGQIAAGGLREEMIIVEGMAIYYPEKAARPEGSNP